MAHWDYKWHIWSHKNTSTSNSSLTAFSADRSTICLDLVLDDFFLTVRRWIHALREFCFIWWDWCWQFQLNILLHGDVDGSLLRSVCCSKQYHPNQERSRDLSELFLWSIAHESKHCPSSLVGQKKNDSWNRWNQRKTDNWSLMCLQTSTIICEREPQSYLAIMQAMNVSEDQRSHILWIHAASRVRCWGIATMQLCCLMSATEWHFDSVEKRVKIF